MADSDNCVHDSSKAQRLSPFVKDSDLLIIISVSSGALLVLIIFGVALFASGLLDFPEPSERGVEAYFSDALFYKERRVTLSLTLRSFLTGFSFVVGLALSTIGGVFILRQVTSLTRFSLDGGGGAAEADAAKPLGPLGAAAFKFEAYSPGITFLLGGLIVMVATQYLALPVSTIEVYPGQAIGVCVDQDSSKFVNCADLRKPSSQDTRSSSADEGDQRSQSIFDVDGFTGPSGYAGSNGNDTNQ